MNLTAAYAVELDVNRALSLPGRTLRLLKNKKPSGYEVIRVVPKGWNLLEPDEDAPLRVLVAELALVTRDNLSDTSAIAIDETVYEIGSRIKPFVDTRRIWTFNVSPTRDTITI